MKRILLVLMVMGEWVAGYSQITKDNSKDIVTAVDSIEGGRIDVSMEAGHYFVTYKNFLYQSITVHDCIVFTNKTILKNTLLTVKKMYSTSDKSGYNIKIAGKAYALKKSDDGTVFLMNPTKRSACRITQDLNKQMLAAL